MEKEAEIERAQAPNKKDFVPYLLLLKVIAIVAVLLSHASYRLDVPNFGETNRAIANLWSAVVRNAPPIFVMVSGALVLRPGPPIDVVGFYRKRLPRLLVPLLAWSFVYQWLYRSPEGFDFGNFIRGFLTDGISGHLWFMYMIFTIYLAAPFVHRMLMKLEAREVVILLAIFLLYAPTIALLRRYFEIHSGFKQEYGPFSIFLFYFIAGYYMHHLLPAARRKGLTVFLCLLVFLAAVAYTYFMTQMHRVPNGKMDTAFFQDAQFQNVLKVICFFLLMRALPLENYRPSRLMTALSASIYGIYLAHIVAMNSLRILFERHLGMPSVFHNALWGIPAVAAMVLLLTFGCVFVLTKIPWLRRTVG